MIIIIIIIILDFCTYRMHSCDNDFYKSTKIFLFLRRWLLAKRRGNLCKVNKITEKPLKEGKYAPSILDFKGNRACKVYVVNPLFVCTQDSISFYNFYSAAGVYFCLVNHQGNATHTLWQYKLSHLTPAIELNWKIKRIEIWQVPLIKSNLNNFLMKNCTRLLETNCKPPKRYPGYQRFFLACVGELRFFGRRLTLFKTWPKPETAHEKPLAPRVPKRNRIPKKKKLDKSTTFKRTILHYTFLLTQIKAHSDELIYFSRITVINYMQCTFEQISLNDVRFCHEVVFATEVIKY